MLHRHVVRSFFVFFVAALAGCSSTTRSTAPRSEVIASASDECREGDPEACGLACSYNVATASDEAGRSHELGNGVTRSGVAAKTFLPIARRAISATSMGCYNAAYLLEHGGAGRHDVGCALAMYRQACEEANHALSCMSMGRLDVPRDEDRARDAFKRACDAGHSAACSQLHPK